MQVNSTQPTSRQTTIPTSTTKNLRLSESEKRAHVRAYVKSNLSREAYCEEHGLKISSFRNWTTRYRPKRMSDFVPVVATPQAKVAHKLSHITIFKGDCKVALNDISSVKLIVEIIKGVFACN